MPLNLTEIQVTEIATAIRRGMDAYIHREHGRILIADDPERNVRADPDVFEIVMQTVSTDPQQYYQIERLSPQQGIDIMKAFVDRIRDQVLWQTLSYALKRPRPFQTFKTELGKYPKAYEKWQDFRQKQYEKYVLAQLSKMSQEDSE